MSPRNLDEHFLWPRRLPPHLKFDHFGFGGGLYLLRRTSRFWKVMQNIWGSLLTARKKKENGVFYKAVQLSL
jgi:hypothetical protein